MQVSHKRGHHGHHWHVGSLTTVQAPVRAIEIQLRVYPSQTLERWIRLLFLFRGTEGSHVSSITSVLVAPTPPLSLPWSSKGTLANKNAVSIKPSIHPKIPHREQCGHCWVSNQGVKRLTDQMAAGHFGRDFFRHGLKHSFSKVLPSNIIERMKGSWVFLSLDPTLYQHATWDLLSPWLSG